MIKIGIPYVSQYDEYHYRLYSDVVINDEIINLYFEVTEDNKEFLCTERCDAFLIALLPLAMKNGFDIISDCPVTEELKYKLESFFMPTLSDKSSVLKSVKINAPTGMPLENCHKVGTGISCGVDSFYSVYLQLETEYDSLRLTHLCLFNFKKQLPSVKKIYERQLEKAKKISESLNLSLLTLESNLYEVLVVPDDYNFLNTYYISSVVLSVQKLFGVYFIASSYDFGSFNCDNAESTDCTHYDLLNINCFSTNNLHFYSQGGGIDRFYKTKYLSDKELVERYLHICNEHEYNCCQCPKCKRTMMTLESLNTLPNFGKVFNLEYFNKNKFDYYYWLFKQHCKGEFFTKIPYDLLKNTELMKAVVEKDNLWHFFDYANGIYDDNWLSSEATFHFCPSTEYSSILLSFYNPQVPFAGDKIEFYTDRYTPPLYILLLHILSLFLWFKAVSMCLLILMILWIQGL